KAQAVEKMNNPPLQGPPSLQHVPVSSLAGGLTLFQGADTQGSGLRPIFEVRPPVQEMRFDIKEIQDRVDQAFMVDLFMAISTQQGVQPKNQLELMQVNEERLLQMGPVLERIHNE
ncbi:MAG: phage tail protein, partial [Anaerolineae bacterium]|nr:phage tail protein [Anaerolineae bacterium]